MPKASGRLAVLCQAARRIIFGRLAVRLAVHMTDHVCRTHSGRRRLHEHAANYRHTTDSWLSSVGAATRAEPRRTDQTSRSRIPATRIQQWRPALRAATRLHGEIADAF